ncbi:hypothetical protein DASC09_026840 [Saccharomycopsis crataegensis]|uniref:Uncharacterized protein n=1 Tax=Saccharomycopsis crataegensis TaxID=43959 RepID=A0AAV5QL63_9ASCO|nr:hypothetical protein DASC09_026840 [Saccharomycopsis crataegensis]
MITTNSVSTTPIYKRWRRHIIIMQSAIHRPSEKEFPRLSKPSIFFDPSMLHSISRDSLPRNAFSSLIELKILPKRQFESSHIEHRDLPKLQFLQIENFSGTMKLVSGINLRNSQRLCLMGANQRSFPIT